MLTATQPFHSGRIPLKNMHRPITCIKPSKFIQKKAIKTCCPSGVIAALTHKTVTQHFRDFLSKSCLSLHCSRIPTFFYSVCHQNCLDSLHRLCYCNCDFLYAQPLCLRGSDRQYDLAHFEYRHRGSYTVLWV